MSDVLVAFAISFAVIFVAELGDKSQLMALTFATRYRTLPVLVGITIATAVVHAVSVAVGYGLGASLPTGWIALVAAVAFVGFGAWTLRGDTLTERERRKASASGGSAVVAASVAFFLAELGDKTMLATITLATQHGWFGVWLGSTAGMVMADALAIVVGRRLGRMLPERTIRFGAAGLFFVFGLWLAVDALGGLAGVDVWGVASDELDHHAAGWIALALGAAAIVLVMLGRRRATTGPTRRRRLAGGARMGGAGRWGAGLFAVAVVLGLASPLLVGVDAIQPISVFSDPGIVVVGAGVTLAGVALLLAAQASRGSPMWVDHRPGLGARGLYAKVRNPGFTGIVVATAGLLAMVPTLLGVLATVLIVVAVQIQARAVREPRLAEAYGAAYVGYMQRSGRFLPRLRPVERPGLTDRVRVG